MYTYIILCRGGTLYTGVAADLERRMNEHYFKMPECAKYTRSHPMEMLLAAWESESRSSACRLEYLIKTLPRSAKLRLAEGSTLPLNVFGDRLKAVKYHAVPSDIIQKVNQSLHLQSKRSLS